MQKRDEYYAIGKGYMKLRAVDQPKVKKEIMNALNHKSRQAFDRVRKGERSLLAHEYAKIRRIFVKYGVKDPFGFADTQTADGVEVKDQESDETTDQ